MPSEISFEYADINSLIPYALNSRTHSDEQVAQIAASIREFGFLIPVLVDSNGGLIAGHGRILAARKLGLVKIPVVVADGLTETQKKAYVIADNQLALNAGWDLDILRVELEALAEMNFDTHLLGFDDDFLRKLLIDENGGLTDPDDAPDVQTATEPATQPGDMWLLGQHRLMCGDATVAEQVATLCEHRLVDIWLTDPPYNVAYVGKTAQSLTIKNDAMPDADFRAFLTAAYRAADASMKPGAAFYIWHADSEGYNFRGAVVDTGWQVRQCLIWQKNSMVLGRQDYQWQHEPCIYGWKDGAAHLWAADRKQTTLLDFARPQRNDNHPTMKPVALMEYLLGNNTKGGDVVLDSFGGSGSTLIAAEKSGRIARLMEIDPRYCDVIIRRWQDFTGLAAVLEKSQKTFVDCSPP